MLVMVGAHKGKIRGLYMKIDRNQQGRGDLSTAQPPVEPTQSEKKQKNLEKQRFL